MHTVYNIILFSDNHYVVSTFKLFFKIISKSIMNCTYKEAGGCEEGQGGRGVWFGGRVVGVDGGTLSNDLSRL